VAYALYREEDLSIYLRQFFVLPAHRRKGIGRLAFSSLRAEFWPPGKRVTVEALLKNETGIAFWRAVGFSDYYLGLTLPPDQ
jgi:GNAT superfamily N-acetyltransferase